MDIIVRYCSQARTYSLTISYEWKYDSLYYFSYIKLKAQQYGKNEDKRRVFYILIYRIEDYCVNCWKCDF